MTKLKAIVFDSDGTLLDSREIIMAAYRHVALAHGLRPPSGEEVMRHMGKALHDMYKGLFPGHDPAPLLITNGEYIVAHRTEVKGYAGLHDMLEDFSALGLRLGVVTSGNHKVLDLFKHHNIERCFGSIVHSERVIRQKPHSEGLLLALSELDVSPEQAVMVGDMRHDIEIGKNAGVAMTIGVTHGFSTRQQLEAAGADYIVDSLGELLPLLKRQI